MQIRWTYRTLIAAIAGIAGITLASPAVAQSFAQGPEVCNECHKAEFEVWQGSKHFKSFREIAAKPLAKELVAIVGATDMRRAPVCMTCHFSEARKAAADRPRLVGGPSCESCHGASSDWLSVHNNYGGPTVKKEQEAPAAKQARIQKAAQAGMIWSFDHYEIAENCNSCHGLASAKLDAAVMGKLVDAGHPVDDFELVRYSQGTVRHRFYPPNVTQNAQMTPAELSRLFLTGQAAALVAVAQSAPKIQSAKFQAVAKPRGDKARAALDAVKGQVPEAGALLGQPTEANAKAFVKAIQGKDLSAAVSSMLPAPNTYK
ncbi:MAG: cytochrome c family protein [Alphaproteobacteria bacterium]|nr:cytochrome c family protein [Alphaproteobacteria bacterium]